MGFPVYVYVIGVVLVVGLYRLLQVGKRHERMPPGPPTLPVLGNLHQIPVTGLFKQYVPPFDGNKKRGTKYTRADLHSYRFREWSKQYGSVFSLTLGSANVVVLCDRKAVHNLLVIKGGNFSDRPPSYVGNLLTQGDHVALEQMDPIWREKRKVISHTFSPKQLDEKHYKVQEAEYVTCLSLAHNSTLLGSGIRPTDAFSP